MYELALKLHLRPGVTEPLYGLLPVRCGFWWNIGQGLPAGWARAALIGMWTADNGDTRQRIMHAAIRDFDLFIERLLPTHSRTLVLACLELYPMLSTMSNLGVIDSPASEPDTWWSAGKGAIAPSGCADRAW